MPLNFNFLTTYHDVGAALDKIGHEMPWKNMDFRQTLKPNNIDAYVWLIEELQKTLDPEKPINVVILNSWLGFPLVPMLFENIPNISRMTLVELDAEALELSHIFTKNYSKRREGIPFDFPNLDIPFSFDQIGNLDADLVISVACETMYPLKSLKMKKSDCVFACQSSNVFREMYGINCVPTIDAHIENAGINEILYEGSIKQSYWSFDGKIEYDRFMVIGRK